MTFLFSVLLCTVAAFASPALGKGGDPTPSEPPESVVKAGAAESRHSYDEAVRLRMSAWQYYKNELATNPHYPLLQDWNDENLIDMVPDLLHTHDTGLLSRVLQALAHTTAIDNTFRPFPLLNSPPTSHFFKEALAFYDSHGGLGGSQFDFFAEGLWAAAEGRFARSKRLLVYGLRNLEDAEQGQNEDYTYFLGAVDLALGQQRNAVSNFYATLLYRWGKTEPGPDLLQWAAATYLSTLPNGGL